MKCSMQSLWESSIMLRIVDVLTPRGRTAEHQTDWESLLSKYHVVPVCSVSEQSPCRQGWAAAKCILLSSLSPLRKAHQEVKGTLCRVPPGFAALSLSILRMWISKFIPQCDDATVCVFSNVSVADVSSNLFKVSKQNCKSSFRLVIVPGNRRRL